MTMTSTAWESAKLTQVLNFMDIKLIGDITEVYAIQELYTATVRRVIDEMVLSNYVQDFDEAATLLKKHKNYFNSINLVEAQLVKSYRKYLENTKVMGQ